MEACVTGGLERDWAFHFRLLVAEGESICTTGSGRALRSNRLKVERKTNRPLRVVIVNPDETTEITFRRLLGPNITNFVFHQATFRSFVGGLGDNEEG
jgi:hypothetical protein